MALQEGATALSAGEAARLVGVGAADRNGRGNVNVGDGGVAFVLAAAAGTPGGPDTVRCKDVSYLCRDACMSSHNARG